MSYLSHTLEYPPASLSVWLPDEGISEYHQNRDSSKCKQSKQQLIMAPSTPSTTRPSTLIRSSRPGEYDTIQKGRFYNAYDTRAEGLSLRDIADANAPSLTTAHRWLQERA
jgi:hypothetical protein